MTEYTTTASIFNIVRDGWMRDFAVEQTVREARDAGFDIDAYDVQKIWELLEDRMISDMEGWK
jgi:hypothetical protein